MAPWTKSGIVFTTFDEFAFQFRQQFELLFTHSFTEGIRLAPGEQSQGPGLEHYLFLVDGNAVSVFQVGLHHRMVVFNGFFAVFAPDEGRDILHRPRTIQGVHGYQVLETVGLEGAEVFFHSGRLELEQPGGISAGEKLEGFFVVQGNFVFIQDDMFRIFCIVETSLEVERVRKPRKSILISPIGSTKCPSYWVVIRLSPSVGMIGI